jgi:predicted lysophospholipase L1 biosynthesis ABC-type transport system permease subunit
VLGGLAALALLVLAGQAMTQLLDRSTPELAGLRAVGASRGQAALTSGLAGVAAILAGTALALAVAAGAVLSLALTLLASVRRRRREFALLKTLGLTRRQVMAAVAWQASVILVIAALLGAAADHWAWAAFATSLGAVPVTVVPVLALLAGFVVLLGAGNLLAADPGAVAARTPPAAVLCAE